MWKQPNLSARIEVKSLLGGVGAILKQRKLARMGAKSVLGSAGAILKKQNP